MKKQQNLTEVLAATALPEHLVPFRDLGLPSDQAKLVQKTRQSVFASDRASEVYKVALAITGFRLSLIKQAHESQHGGARQKGEKVSLPWKDLVPQITGKSYDQGRRYIKRAEELMELEPDLVPLAERDFEDFLPEEQASFVQKISKAYTFLALAGDAHILGHAKAPDPAGNNNPNGANGSKNLPLSPKEKAEKLRFEALTSWFGNTEPERPKPGSAAYLLFREVGMIKDLDDEESKPTWVNLPRETQEILLPALDKLTKEIRKTIKES